MKTFSLYLLFMFFVFNLKAVTNINRIIFNGNEVSTIRMNGKTVSNTWRGALAADQAAASSWWTGIGLTAVYTMDEGSGSVVYDKVGNIAGQLTGGVVWGFQENRKVLTFDGVSGWINCGDNFDALTNNFMYTSWIYLNRGLSDYASICEKYSSASGGIRQLMSLDANRLGRGLLRDGIYQASSGCQVAIPSNVWTFIACHYDRLNKKSYFALNDVIYISDNQPIVTNNMDTTANFEIGSMVQTPTRYFPGYIRDFSFKLNGSTNDIISVYNATKERYGK